MRFPASALIGFVASILCVGILVWLSFFRFRTEVTAHAVTQGGTPGAGHRLLVTCSREDLEVLVFGRDGKGVLGCRARALRSRPTAQGYLYEPEPCFPPGRYLVVARSPGVGPSSDPVANRRFRWVPVQADSPQVIEITLP
ncbi:MAG: hypothetical protein AB1486_16120 [Planctomycetota bacterium]